MCLRAAPKKDYKIEKDYRGTCSDANNVGSLCHINSAQEAARLCDRIGSCTFFQWSGPRGFQRGAKDQYKNCVWLCNKVPPLLKSWRVGEEEKYRGWMAGSVFVPGKPSPSPTPPLMLKTNLELRLTGMTVTQFAKATAHKKNPFILGAAHFFKVSHLDVSVQSVKASGVGANGAAQKEIDRLKSALERKNREVEDMALTLNLLETETRWRVENAEKKKICFVLFSLRRAARRP